MVDLATITREELEAIRQEMTRPSVLYRPRVILEGDKYGVIYGENIMSGCAGFGASLADAMVDFDRNWTREAPPVPSVERPAP